jgi:hypothetical protein
MVTPSKAALLHRKPATTETSRDTIKGYSEINNYCSSYSNFPWCHFKISTCTKEFGQKINANQLFQEAFCTQVLKLTL